MKKGLLIISLVSFLSVLFLNGCVPSKQVEEERVISADRLMKRLEANRRKVKSFTGTGTIYINSPDIDAKSNFQVEIKKPDSVKVSFYGPFGIDLASALITPQNFQFFDIINNNLYRGKLKSDAMKSILKINISFDDLMDMLTCSINLTDKLRREPDKYETTGDYYQLTYFDSSAARTSLFMIRKDDLGVSEYNQKDSKGKNLVSTQYSNFRKIDESSIPYIINLNDELHGQKIKIEYRSVELNTESGSLKLSVPNDAKIIDW